MADELIPAGPVDSSRVPDQPAEAIRWHERAAELLTEKANGHRWEAARLIASELDNGKTQRALAEEIGKSKSHVVYMAMTWNEFGHHGDQERSFDSYYQEVKSKPPELTPADVPLKSDSTDKTEPDSDDADWDEWDTDPMLGTPPSPPRPVAKPSSASETSPSQTSPKLSAPSSDDDVDWDAIPEPDPTPDPPVAPTKSPPIMLSLRTHTGEEVPYPKPQAKATFNETTGEGISWAAWSWNPVTGCLHGCDYCYARSIAARYVDTYPAGFTPVFHHDPDNGYTRLDAPANTVIPAAHRNDEAYERVFVCSMADLYGRWVPDEWIKQVHESMLATPSWQYILLTKFPARYVGLDIPPKAWVGTSVDEQKRVRIAQEAMSKVDGGMIRWLSLEPLREPLEFDDLSMFDWVVIGAQTATRQPDGPVDAFVPDWPWWFRLALQAHEAGCKVHIKPNLFNGRPGVMPNEYPVSMVSALEPDPF